MISESQCLKVSFKDLQAFLEIAVAVYKADRSSGQYKRSLDVSSNQPAMHTFDPALENVALHDHAFSFV